MAEDWTFIFFDILHLQLPHLDGQITWSLSSFIRVNKTDFTTGTLKLRFQWIKLDIHRLDLQERLHLTRSRVMVKDPISAKTWGLSNVEQTYCTNQTGSLPLL